MPAIDESKDDANAVWSEQTTTTKSESQQIEECDSKATLPPVIRSKEDDLGIWPSMRRYRWVSFVGLLASFSAALDGYQINLNGGVVSNKGFIRQMAKPGTTIIDGKYVSAWGGIQSAGQTVGQILLQYATEALGRKPAMYIIWLVLLVSVFIESFATRWEHWLIAKLFSGVGVGMLQATMPLYLSEIAPTQLRGLFINAYSFWFVLGQLFASLALNRLNAIDPYNFRTPIYTQWAMIGSILLIFLFLSESPWWLASKDRFDQAGHVLHRLNGSVPGYSIPEQISIMTTTLSHAHHSYDPSPTHRAILQHRNPLRLLIAAWPKITQQLLGLALFNTYATYFFQAAGNHDPFRVTTILSSVQLASMLLTALLTDRVGRRPLTVYPFAVTSLAVLGIGVVGCFDYTAPPLAKVLVLCACVATFATTGASAVGYAYAAEVPTQRLRARTAGWALALSNAVAVMFSFVTPVMIEGPAGWGVRTGFFFAATGSIAVVIAWFILPEVARRTTGEIDELFEARVPLRKFDKYVTKSGTVGSVVESEKVEDKA